MPLRRSPIRSRDRPCDRNVPRCFRMAATASSFQYSQLRSKRRIAAAQERGTGNRLDQSSGHRVKKTSNKASVVPRILPRGRHKLDPELVAASQRQRLLEAITELVAEK